MPFSAKRTENGCGDLLSAPQTTRGGKFASPCGDRRRSRSTAVAPWSNGAGALVGGLRVSEERPAGTPPPLTLHLASSRVLSRIPFSRNPAPQPNTPIHMSLAPAPHSLEPINRADGSSNTREVQFSWAQKRPYVPISQNPSPRPDAPIQKSLGQAPGTLLGPKVSGRGSLPPSISLVLELPPAPFLQNPVPQRCSATQNEWGRLPKVSRGPCIMGAGVFRRPLSFSWCLPLVPLFLLPALQPYAGTH